ncbi:MAG: hypothetical protein Tsb002_03640 [Wenzhouxiangellaceae bacterium]
MKNSDNRTLFVATDEQLKNRQYYWRLWLSARNMPFARREWLDVIADAIRDFDGSIMIGPGLPYKIPCIDTAFGDDPEMRWLGQYLKAADPLGTIPHRHCTKIERLRLIDLYFRIRFPELAAHFGR